MVPFVDLEKRASDVFAGLASDFAEYSWYANWNREHAIRLGPLHDRFELHVHSYAKAIELVRHHYFKETDWQRSISFYEAIDLFANDGYEIGFNEHWTNGFKRDMNSFNRILYAPSMEIAHQIIGDYEPLTSDGRLMHPNVQGASAVNSGLKERAA